MWPFRRRKPIAATNARELSPLIAAAIENEIGKFGVHTLSELSFAFNPHREIIIIRGSQDRPRAAGLLPSGTRIAAVKSHPDALAAIESAYSHASSALKNHPDTLDEPSSAFVRARSDVELEANILLLGLAIASVLIDE